MIPRDADDAHTHRCYTTVAFELSCHRPCERPNCALKGSRADAVRVPLYTCVGSMRALFTLSAVQVGWMVMRIGAMCVCL